MNYCSGTEEQSCQLKLFLLSIAVVLLVSIMASSNRTPNSTMKPEKILEVTIPQTTCIGKIVTLIYIFLKYFQASFHSKNLTWETADALILRMTSLTALDLSYNRIDNFPKFLSSTLIALNLSYNTFSEIPRCSRLCSLIELRLRGNHITE